MGDRTDFKLKSDETELAPLFFDGLPMMAGIVTLTTQPFAQASLRTMFRLPDWLPIVLGLVVSSLLAFYKVRFVRRSSLAECAVCVPLLMFVIFAAYVAGNNVVYYAKDGLTRPDASGKAPAAEEVSAWTRERDILRQKVQNAERLVETLRQSMGVSGASEGRPQTSLLSLLARLSPFSTGSAQAQERRDEPRAPARPPTPTGAQVREALKEYEVQQRKLNQELEQIKRDQGKARETQQQPLIKSW